MCGKEYLQLGYLVALFVGVGGAILLRSFTTLPRDTVYVVTLVAGFLAFVAYVVVLTMLGK